MINGKKIGLALSGGGYRATAFHLGTLKKLHELGILEKVDVISSISGGSITAAAYCLQNESFEKFHSRLQEALQHKSVVKNVLFSPRIGLPLLFFGLTIIGSILILCTKFAILFPFIIAILIYVFIKFQFIILPFGKEIERAYNKFFFSNKVLSDLLNDKPTLVIGTTNLSTSRPFTFSKEKMYDSTYESNAYKSKPILFKQAEFPISRAVVASTCIPVPFTPVSIDIKYFYDAEDFVRINPKLIDGGIYDNQGIHKITFDNGSNKENNNNYLCDTIITSDAGYKLPDIKKYNNSFSVIWRTLDVLMERIKNFQMVQNLYNNVKLANKPIAYFSLSWDLKSCIPRFVNNLKSKKIILEVINANKIKDEYVAEPEKFRLEIERLLKNNVGYEAIEQRNLSSGDLFMAQNVGTNLTKLKALEVKYLMQHAENMTELQVRLYCPSLIKPQQDEN